MKWWERIKKTPFFIRLFNFEYWSVYTFYLPMTVYFPWLALRSRHPCFFTATNPGIPTGGLGMESKFEIILKIPEPLRPKTAIAYYREPFRNICEKIKAAGISFPLIVKPDVGYRGLLVKKLLNEEDLKNYLEKYPVDFIIQEFVDLKEEFGVLYYRFPDEDQGRISSVTLKEFLHVIGDGRSTVRELVEKNPRALLQLERLRDTHSHILQSIPAKGERIPLGEIGNHSKGTFFRNGNHLIDRQVIETFNRISKNIDGIYYGRYDVKCSSWEDLKKGKNLKIIEINGVCSEPTHIYDPGKSSYLKAVRDIFRHWNIIRKIGLANHEKGVPFMKPLAMIRAILDLRSYFKLLRRSAL